MADHHSHTHSESRMDRYILIAFVLLSIVYLLAKGCTNRAAKTTEQPHHGYHYTIPDIMTTG